jgi:hypothetical protein
MAKRPIATVEQATAIPTKHVALLAEDGTVIYHEELPVAAAPHRHYMFSLQAELDARDEGKNEATYMGDAWPPPGKVEVDGKLLPAEPEAPAEV